LGTAGSGVGGKAAGLKHGDEVADDLDVGWVAGIPWRVDEDLVDEAAGRF